MKRFGWNSVCAAVLGLSLATGALASDLDGFSARLAMAEALSGEEVMAQFYQSRDFAPLWTGSGAVSAERRQALLNALSNAEDHGLPAARYNVDAVMAQMRDADTAAKLITLEADLTRLYLKYARDVSTGIIRPSSVNKKEMVRKVTPIPQEELLAAIASDTPTEAMAGLPPQSAQYRGLQALKLRMEALVDAGGWGATVPEGKKLQIGSAGPRVLALRERLNRLGYEIDSTNQTFDLALEDAVKRFQSDKGLNQDGVVGSGTLAQLNQSAEERLKSVIVALERERWIPRELGQRHILVNQTDFTARIIDDGDVTFVTRAVIGSNVRDQRSPEFSDEMEHLVINPSWYVPRSIVTKEYLPKLQADPYAVNHLEVRDRAGNVIPRESVDFTQFTQADFPFGMRQPPGTRNALGLVKFMFPNRHNIYLHDTPHKSLFARDRRTFSHGCIRLAQPFEFAYALLAVQEEDPEAFFKRILNTGKEATVHLDQHVPVHLIYRTAWIGPNGETWFRNDMYGRDAQVWSALQDAGVTLDGIRS